jgi:hypothetical protein
MNRTAIDKKYYVQLKLRFQFKDKTNITDFPSNFNFLNNIFLGWRRLRRKYCDFFFFFFSFTISNIIKNVFFGNKCKMYKSVC